MCSSDLVDKSVHPMSALRTAVSLLAHTDEKAEDQSEEATLLKGVRIQAKIPSIVAAIARTREGQEVVDPNPEYGYAKNFLYMLYGKEPTPVQVEAMNKALILHADHEINASTFAARVIVATLSDVYSGVTCRQNQQWNNEKDDAKSCNTPHRESSP